jgi:hypothetical protein
MNDEQLNRQLRAMVDGAAAPLSQTEVVLRASSPSRQSRRDWHLTTHRLMVVAVAAVIVMVFFVPLPHASLFKRLVSSARPSTATSLPTTVPSTGTSVPTTVTSTTVFQSVKVPSKGVVGQSVGARHAHGRGLQGLHLHPTVFLKYRPGRLCHNHLSEAGLACASRWYGLSNCLRGSPGSGTDFVRTVTSSQMILGYADYRPGSSNTSARS